MNFLNFLKLFILFFVVYLTEGTFPPMHSGRGIQLNTNPPTNEFSFTELSFLLRVLQLINAEEFYDKEVLITNKTIQGSLHQNAQNVITSNFEIDLENRQQMIVIQNIQNIIGKMNSLFDYFGTILNRYNNNITEYFENLEETRNEIKEKKIDFIYFRLVDYGIVLTEEKYKALLDEYNVGYFEDEDFIHPNRENIGDEQINTLLNNLKFPSQKEINLLFLYYLYAIARTLIVSFITNNAKHYINLFNLSTTTQNKQVSIVNYVKEFDLMEVSANKIYNYLNQSYIFSFLDENYLYYDFINTPGMTEEHFVATYPVRCVIAYYEYINLIPPYMQMFFMFTKPIESTLITEVEYAKLLRYRVDDDADFNLYRLYFSRYLQNQNVNLRNKIETDYINPQLIEAIGNGDIVNDIELRNIVGREGTIIPRRLRRINIPTSHVGGGNDDGAAGSHHETGQSSRRRPRNDGSGGSSSASSSRRGRHNVG